ncbi:septation protein IspZ [Gammaproteobacteria bacterium]|jgi:intracellular septation protein|nr:septation protein IspZ [Gammaproteobacteria bacterium]MDB2374793.1 septation protein IspZ [Gammaproteobacteria bacterium]MDC3229527.1 septation protein IspZ [bacterium]
MKQLIDYIPLLVFFLVWSLDERLVSIGGYERTVGGVFSAAEFLLVASTLVYGVLWLKEKRLDKFQWITFVAVVLFCIPTIVFRNIEFLKWKAPIVNWLFASIFLGSRFIGEKPAIEHMMGHAVPAPRVVWQRLNLYWVLYFIVLGAINLAVALLLSEALWIKFKVFGNLALTFGFVLAQMPLLSKYLEEPDGDTLK